MCFICYRYDLRASRIRLFSLYLFKRKCRSPLFSGVHSRPPHTVTLYCTMIIILYHIFIYCNRNIVCIYLGYFKVSLGLRDLQNHVIIIITSRSKLKKTIFFIEQYNTLIHPNVSFHSSISGGWCYIILTTIYCNRLFS